MFAQVGPFERILAPLGCILASSWAPLFGRGPEESYWLPVEFAQDTARTPKTPARHRFLKIWGPIRFHFWTCFFVLFVCVLCLLVRSFIFAFVCSFVCLLACSFLVLLVVCFFVCLLACLSVSLFMSSFLCVLFVWLFVRLFVCSHAHANTHTNTHTRASTHRGHRQPVRSREYTSAKKHANECIHTKKTHARRQRTLHALVFSVI